MLSVWYGMFLFSYNWGGGGWWWWSVWRLCHSLQQKLKRNTKYFIGMIDNLVMSKVTPSL